MFVAGIILATLRVKDKQDFEYKMQQIHVMYGIMQQNEDFYHTGIQQVISQYGLSQLNLLYGEWNKKTSNVKS